MKRALRGSCACATALLVSVLAGYSECRADAPLSAVPGQVSAALHVQQWGQILWGLVTTQTGTQTPWFGEPVINPDGSLTQSFSAADGTEVTLTVFPDGSAHLEISFPDGTIQTVMQSAPIFDGISVTAIDWSVSSSDGLSVDYTSLVDDAGTPFDISDDVTELLGTSVLPGDISQEFSVLTAGGMTGVYSVQSDGSTFTLNVPLAAPDFILPDFSRGATGTYTAPHSTVDFVLASTPTYPFRWAALLSDFGGGVTGAFSLENDFSGFGQLYESRPWGDVLAALLSWRQDGETHVYLLTGQDRAMGPSGAAEDYLTHRWQTLTALLGPAPGAAASIERRSRHRTGPRWRTDPRRQAGEPLPQAGGQIDGGRARDGR